MFDVGALSPQNLVDQGLIDASQLSDAAQKFSTNEISIFETKRIKFIGNQQLLQFTAQQTDEFEPLRDLALGALRLLNSPQLGVLGINHDVHFAVANSAEWHSIGDSLVPKGIWSDLVEYPGTASLVVQGVRPGKYDGYSQVTIQPSNLVPQGVFVSHNDHYTLEVDDQPPANRDQFNVRLRKPTEVSPDKLPIALSILNEEWDPSMTRSLTVIERIARQARL